MFVERIVAVAFTDTHSKPIVRYCYMLYMLVMFGSTLSVKYQENKHQIYEMFPAR